MNMQKKSIWKILAILGALVMVVSCATPSFAVDNHLTNNALNQLSDIFPSQNIAANNTPFPYHRMPIDDAFPFDPYFDPRHSRDTEFTRLEENLSEVKRYSDQPFKKALTENASRSTVSLSSNTIYVPDGYAKIQWAVDNASAGDTIIVRDGTYTENVDVNVNNLTIQSENGPDSTIVQAALSWRPTFKITASSAIIKGFTAKGAAEGGILLDRVSGCTICDNIASNNTNGIFLKYSPDNTLTNNIANSNKGRGIYLSNSNHCILSNNIANLNGANGIDAGAYNTLINNTANWNTRGIVLDYVDNTLTGNTMSDNQYNFDIYTLSHHFSQGSIDTSNKVNGKPVYILMNRDGLVIDSSWDIGYLGIVNCNNITVKDLTIANNGQGIALAHSPNTRIENMNLSNNKCGICVYGGCDNSIITKSNISNNGDAISLASDNISVTENNISENNFGISLGCSWCSISNNNISNNNISNNLFSGISLTAATNNVVVGNNILNIENHPAAGGPYPRGIYLDGSSNNSITQNNISNINGPAFWFTGWRVEGWPVQREGKPSSHNTISGNNISDSWCGMYLSDWSTENYFRNNSMTNNKYNFGICDYASDNFIQDIDTSNLVDGKPMYYLVNQQDKLIDSSSNAGYVGVVNSANITVKSLTLSNCWEGVLFFNITESKIQNVNVSNCARAIRLISCSNNNIVGNTVSNSVAGIELRCSTDNNIHFNNFIENTKSAYSRDSTNIWNSSEEITYTYNSSTYTNYLGNYWDDYTGSDVDIDGIGDTPYTIYSDKDNYPLMEPWENYFPEENKPPTASSIYSPQNPVVNQIITFNASNSTDLDGFITNYELDFGDGTSGTGEVAFHSYSSAGDYTVNLTVTDDDGATDTTSATVSVSTLKPTSIKVFPSSVSLNIGETQQFTATAYDQNNNPITADFSWISSNPTVGTINNTGFFTANAAGTTTVKAENGTVNGTASVSVTALNFNFNIVLTKTKCDPEEIVDIVLIFEEVKGFVVNGISQIEYKFDSESWEQESVSLIGPGVYQFTTQYPSTPGYHTISVKTNIGGDIIQSSESFFLNYVSKKVPVVLVHDYSQDPSSLSLLKQRLENDGFEVYESDYSPEEYNCDAMGNPDLHLGIEWYAKVLKLEIKNIKEETGADKVDIIGYGMGGLIARWYVEKLDGNTNVRKLILLGTPNHGSELFNPSVLPSGLNIPPTYQLGIILIKNLIKDIFGVVKECSKPLALGIRVPSLGTAAEQMSPPCSPFLGVLNYNDPKQCVGWSPDILASNVHYVTIAGTKCTALTTVTIFLFDYNDGFVTVSSARLSGVSGENHAEFKVDHKGLIEDEEVYAKIKERLKAEITESLATKTMQSLQDGPVLGYGTHEQNTTQPQLHPTIFGTIENTTQSNNLTISFTNATTFVLMWEQGDLDLSLISPNATLINSTTHTEGMNITYYPSDGTEIEGYEIKDPVSGNWRADVIPINVSGKVNYTLITSLDTNLTLSVLPDKYNYYPGEQINLTANLTHFDAPVANTSMTLKIARPDGKVENITLVEINESYSGTYNNTNITGQYGIIATANGTLNETDFVRQTTTSLWVEQPPDLMVKNISLSNTTPFIGDNVTINATIENIGDGNATNATIEFYIDNPINGTLIGNETIDIPSNSSEVVSMDWVAEYGLHKIYVVIPASNPFLEENYTNNIAFNSVNVTGPVIKLSLTMPVEITLNDTFVVEALVENSGTELIGAKATIILPSELSTSEPLTIALGNIARNKTVNWNITANQTGLHEICINLTSENSQVYTSRKNISVVHIELSDLPTNLTCYQGGNLSMDIQVANFNPNVSYVGLYLNTSIKDPSDNISSSINNISLLRAGDIETLEILWNQTEKLGVYGVNVSLFMGSVLIDNKETEFEVVSENQPPIANFTYTPEKPVVNQTITFNASSSYDSDGNITNYEWNFGDGNITNTTEKIIMHSYISTGDYIVNLTVTDDDGATNSTNKTITVTADTTPSPSITNLQNITYEQTYINWTWNGPLDEDFSHVIVYLNSSFKENVSKGVQYYNATGLESDTEYTLGTHTVDKVGNINETWVNHTAKTAPLPDTTPPPAPVISSSTHQDEDVWYCNRNPTFSWTTPSDTSGIACYSYALDHSASTTPDDTCDTTENTKSYTNLDYDIWYFHVRAKDNADNWGPADHYKVQIENCDDKDGCYVYDTGCEDRDYYCDETCCAYAYSNRHTDYYDDWVNYCKGDEVWKHRLYHDFYCEGGSCTEHTSWVEDQLVENCNDHDGWVDTGDTRWIDDPGNECKEKEQKEQEYLDYGCSGGSCVYSITDTKWIDTGNERNKPDGTDCGSDYYDTWVNYCEGDEVWKHRLFHDFYCEAGNCTDHTSWENDTFVENCSDSDGWYDTGNTSWVTDPGNKCKEKEQKEQEYRDYTCSDGSCVYSVTNTQWIDTGETRNKPDGTDCGSDYYDDWVNYCKGDEVWKHRLYHDFYCEGGSCIEHTSWVDDQLVENCNDHDGWVDTGDTRWVDDPGNECKEKEQKEQEYRDYTCSGGSCVYSVTDTKWIDTGNTRDRIREIDVRPDSCTMNISEEKQFSAIATLTSGGTEDVTPNASWSSSNTLVLEHKDGGKFKAKSEGIAEVIANHCNKSDISIVNVNASENKLPIASFTYSPENPVVNQATTFDASNSTDQDGFIINYKWDFGDGNITNTTEEIITHSYSSFGGYNVTLTVTDDDGAKNTTSRTIIISEKLVFDTGTGTYPSISGTHNGTIKPNQTITVSKLYTYPCEGTGGHTEYAVISYSNGTVIAETHWNCYVGDWHNISFDQSFMLEQGKTYNYTIRTGSYPQIIHEQNYTTLDGSFINCTEFTDANGKKYDNWIPAIRLWA